MNKLECGATPRVDDTVYNIHNGSKVVVNTLGNSGFWDANDKFHYAHDYRSVQLMVPGYISYELGVKPTICSQEYPGAIPTMVYPGERFSSRW